jgi:hypothetical protein
MISKLAHLGNGPACDISNLRFDPITARPTIANPTASAREVFDSGSARTNADLASFPRTATYAAMRLASASTGDRNPIDE